MKIEIRKDAPDTRYCVRCGILESEVKKNGTVGCNVYSHTYKQHSYITDRELEKWAKENKL